MDVDPHPADIAYMVAKVLRSALSRITAPTYLRKGESFWQAQRRQSFKRLDRRHPGRHRP
jgi:hypothetical protein